MCLNRLIKYSLCYSRVFLKVVHELFGNYLVNERSYLRVAKSALCLSLKLTVCELNGYYSCQTLSYVVAKKLIVVFKIAKLLTVVIYYLCKSIFKACFMSTAVRSMDIISKRKYKVIISIVILQSYLGKSIALHAVDIDNFLRKRSNTSCFVDMLHKLSYTALIMESFAHRLGFISLISEYYLYTGIKECLFSKSFKQCFIVKHCCFLKDLRVRLEKNGSTCFISIADYFQRL